MTQLNVLCIYNRHFRLEPEHIAELKRRFPDVTFREAPDGDPSADLLGDADIIIGWPTAAMVQRAPRLRWVQVPSVGANRYTGENAGVLPDDVLVTNSKGVFDVPGAEHIVALTFALARQIQIHVRQQGRHIWQRNPTALEVSGSAVGIVGLGGIGTEAAKRFHAVGCTVYGVRRRRGSKPSFVEEVFDLTGLDQVMEKANILVLALPGTKDTEGLITRRHLSMLPQDALFVNVGRGTTVDEKALIEALQGGRLFGAGLDVTWEEPLPADSPLWELPNVVITSHSLGVSPRKVERRFELYSDNLQRFLEGRPLRNLVDFELEY